MFHRFCYFLFFASAAVSAAPTRVVPAFEVHATVDKKDTSLHFDKGAAASIINEQFLDGVIGVTDDFAGKQVPAYIVFAPSVTEARLMELVNFQGRLKGVVHCARVRMGNSPLFPGIKVAVLGESCTIESINH